MPMVHNYSGSVYPNGEFTVGVAPRRLKPSEILPVKDTPDRDACERAFALREYGLDAALWAYSSEAPLSLSSVPIPPKRSPKGLKGMSSFGRRMVRNGCYLLEQRFGRGRCGFGTLTLPEMDYDDWQSACRHWGAIVKRFIKEVKRTLDKRGVSPKIIYVTEFQHKRYEKSSRAYPHLHMCYPARPKRSYQWYLSAHQLRDIWERSVNASIVSRYCFRASVNCVVVKKSLGAYLSKYLTKGAGQLARYLEDGLPIECVGHWWGVTGELRAEIKAGIRKHPDAARFLWRNAEALKECGHVKWLRYISIETHLTGQRVIGMCGLLDEAAKAMLHYLYPMKTGVT